LQSRRVLNFPLSFFFWDYPYKYFFLFTPFC
jgi:hypothetical protein